MSNIYIHTLNHLGVRFVAYKIENEITKIINVDNLNNVDISEEIIEYTMELIKQYNINNYNLYLNSSFVNKRNGLRQTWANTDMGKSFLTLLEDNNITLYNLNESPKIKNLLHHRMIEKYDKSKKNELVSCKYYGEKKDIKEYSSVNILIRGIADYVDENNKGYGIAILNKNNVYKELYFKDTNTTANRMLLLSLIGAVELLTKPCMINVYTHTLLGLSSGKTNADLKNKLAQVLENGNHCVNEIVGDVYQNYLNTKIKNHFNENNKDLD